MTVPTKKYKFIHDEIHESKFPTVETILELRTDVNLFTLYSFLRAHKANEGQSSIDIFQVHELQEDGEWKRLDHYHNHGVKREPIYEDRLFYYQMVKKPTAGDPLNGKWVCCGGVNPDTKVFYLSHFSKNYHNGLKKNQDDCMVVIVRGSFGNVADRDARDIRESDIVEKFNY